MYSLGGIRSLPANWRSTTASMTTTESVRKVPQVLTVAGSDSGAGAGIQADLKVCAARGVYCASVITAVTAQNTRGVQSVHLLPPEFVSEQLKSVLSDFEFDVVKTGMLPSTEIVEVLLQNLSEFPVRALVVDPVMVSTSGHVLAGSSVLSIFRERLLPIADIITPNVKEASALLGGVKIETVEEMRSAAKLLHEMGPRFVLVKDFKTFVECGTLLLAELAKGSSMLSAVKVAKRFVDNALDYSKDIVIGTGKQGPFDHFFSLKKDPQSSRCSIFNPDDLFLYAVTDSRMNKKWNRSIVDAVKAAIEGGATIIQLREKEAETREFLEEAKSCVGICRSHGVCLLINDRIDIALACDADGVHVGQSDMPVDLVRSLLGPDKIIGVSCKTPEQAHQAWKDGADYIGSGGVFPTNTKANNRTIGLDGLKTVCEASQLPVVAIGGIGISNAVSVMQINTPNLKGVAVVSALFDQECVLTQTKKLHKTLEESKKEV
ncbi:PREDICTED: thiamine biosynthetic bifunctional enzyme TH1, chloroplastic-like isoform X3 [Camelina sativa]|uniref:thiamine phosphate synthase n=1 Tax=Camelina sativa TaxID=90675 RepID=A0ABM0VRH1_CAMSA|nr:PREDICTED: thiamine biosynthetic bifunctional enzyme TH1, chloroplastic-like isoform X3 [Camelina sativa]